MGDLPEPWRTAAERAGIRQTLRGVAEVAGVSHVTLGRLISQGRTSPETVARVAEALRVDAAKIAEWANVPTTELGPWTPPEAAAKLNARARAALSELILAITQEDEPNADAAAAEKITQGLTSPTQDDYALGSRRGALRGQQLRRQQDDETEAVDPPGPEDGA